MAEWKPFDLKWGRSIWYCSACEESTEVPTYLGTPMYNFCPMCGANMNMKSENKQADTPQNERSEFVKVSDRECPWCKAVCASTDKYCHECGWHIADTPQTESTGSPIGDYRDGVGAWQTDEFKNTDCPWK